MVHYKIHGKLKAPKLLLSSSFATPMDSCSDHLLESLEEGPLGFLLGSARSGL